MNSDFWNRPAVIAPNNFVNKSLSSWSLNIAVGCTHGCRFCYVPEVSTRKMGPKLKTLDVEDADAQWGDYVFLRPWQEPAFLASLAKAERTPPAELNADGNRAIMLCTTTDPYMVLRHRDGGERHRLNGARAAMVRRALELIRDHSTLNVRILTRSPLAREDFDVMRSLGNRLLFGMSLPTLDDKLSRLYEPQAPGPAVRLRTLQAAQSAGLPLYVAIAPTFPECDREDLRRTFAAVAPLDPVTIFHEPINIRAQNVERIAAHARALGVPFRREVFATDEAWAGYSMEQMEWAEQLAAEFGVSDRLHLWPDADLDGIADSAWLNQWWGKISAWPQ